MQSVHASPGLFLNMKEFGVELFEAIKLCGAVEQLLVLREQSAIKHVKPGQLTEWQQREKDCIKQLLQIISRLGDDDVAEIFRKYPWVSKH